jgi:hypothetical protein
MMAAPKGGRNFLSNRRQWRTADLQMVAEKATLQMLAEKAGLRRQQGSNSDEANRDLILTA